MKRGVFVTFEGIEGCGKSTQLRLASEWLAAQGIRVLCTREPGGTEIGSQIRKILLSEKSAGLLPLSEALLYLADRFQHITEVILPELRKGGIVFSDRYHDSTVAYQGFARQIPMDLLNAVWTGSGISLTPDLTILLDVDPQTGIERSLRKLHQNQMDESRFENEALAFHTRVRDGFLSLAAQSPARFVILNAAEPVPAVHRQVIRILQNRLELP